MRISGETPVRRTWSKCSMSSGAATSTATPVASSNRVASYSSSW